MREWLQPLDIYAGAGWQVGLRNGTLQYARECGFSGMVSSYPIDMEGAQNATAYPSRETYPEALTYAAITQGETR